MTHIKYEEAAMISSGNFSQFEGNHTFDVEMAVDDLKEIYEQKCNERNLM